MLTKLTIRNFKRFEEAEIELGNPVVFIGPNNSGKTSAMQALTLWDIGVKRWNEKRFGKAAPEKRPGVTVNRRDLLAVPHPSAIHLWRDLRVRNVQRIDGRQVTENLRIDIVVEGVMGNKAWTCGLEFDYANEESYYCRPLRLGDGKTPDRMPVPAEVGAVHVTLLPPMSGLTATETRLDKGAINVRVGEGRTAEVLRNLCFRIHQDSPKEWELLTSQLNSLFGAQLDTPRYIEERGEIAMGYTEHGVSLDLSSSGRGLQQTLLILAYLHANRGSVILLDEPDAHLEILRQRQIYRLITEAAASSGNQIIAASHSEVLLNDAAGKDLVVAFVGAPHRIGNEKSQVRKALAEIGFDQYYQAEQTGWVLYLEGSTDLAILQAFAKRLNNEAAVRALDRPFVHYVGNQPTAAMRHYHGLRAALPNLHGIALFDRLEGGAPDSQRLVCQTWAKREIENYLCTQTTLEHYASSSASDAEPLPLFTAHEVDRRLSAMRESIEQVSEAMKTLDKGSPWDGDAKASDDFLVPLFRTYFKKLDLPNLMSKKNFYELAELVPEDEIHSEISEKLDEIARVHDSASVPSV